LPRIAAGPTGMPSPLGAPPRSLAPATLPVSPSPTGTNMPGVNIRTLSDDDHRRAKLAAALKGTTLEAFAAEALVSHTNALLLAHKLPLTFAKDKP
jgi:hypothetical protein